jgi:tetratricopeptide (TPR) repeat protein
MMEALQGSVSDAIPLAERALALLTEGQDARSLARLRTQLGIMQLRLDPPEVAEAQRNLEQAAQELEWCSAGPVEIARNDLALARAHFLEGDAVTARALSAKACAGVGEAAPIVAADAKSVNGQVFAMEGDLAAAKRSYREAVLLLTGIGADRSAAQLWFELAGLLEDVADFDAARDAYRSAAVSSGLRTRTAIRTASVEYADLS